MSNRKALLVGINKFKNYPGATLSGCVNDANDMARLLKDVLGFTDSDITVLTDAQATKAKIMAGLSAMVTEARAGKLKYLVVSLSSHGTQVPDTSQDEPDQADEAFCPHDLAQQGSQWDLNHIIVDDELHDLFVQLPKSVLLECYFDTCHSGTGLKDVNAIAMLMPNAPKPRYLPPPSWEAFDLVNGLSMRGLAGKRKKDKELASHNILWAGCKSDQTSADAFFDGRANGAFTYNLIKVVRESNNQLTRAQVRDRVRALLKKGQFEQIPQLECDATNRNLPAG